VGVDIEHMTYARVTRDATLGEMRERPRDDGVDKFLTDHLAALLKLGEEDRSPVAGFAEADVAGEFERLRTGTRQEFLAASAVLVRRLIAQMDGRSAPGLLLCLRVSTGAELSAAALKLQVVTPNAAVLQRLDSGEEVLSSASNVLDAPGHLQKGALVLGPGRSRRDLIVTDNSSQDALYFPRAFGIRVEQRAIDGAVDMVNALRGRVSDEALTRVARAMPTLPAGDARSVLNSAAQTEPELTDAVRSEAVEALSARRRPVNQVQTDASLTQVLTADGITISGSVEAMRAVRWSQRDDGRWEIVAEVSEQPRIRFR
jgi:hypothetical protein